MATPLREAKHSLQVSVPHWSIIQGRTRQCKPISGLQLWQNRIAMLACCVTTRITQCIR